MTRNFDRRIELMWPLERPEHRARTLHVLRAMFRDNLKAWRLKSDGSYEQRRPADGESPYRVQQALQNDARRNATRARESAGVVFEPEHK
jgi:polyphosphate kinase